MLLSQIFEKAKTPAPNNTTEFIPRVSGTPVDVMKFAVPEEMAVIGKMQIPDNAAHFTVMHVYEEPMVGNIDRQDALKMRRPEFQTAEHKQSLSSLIDKSINAALKYDERYDKGKWENTRLGSRNVSLALSRNDRYGFAVVAIPSSSQLTSMIANAAAKKMGTTPIAALQPNERVQFSKETASKYNDKPVDPSDYKTLEAQYDQLLDQIAAFTARGASQQQMTQYNAQLSLAKDLEKRIERAKNFSHSQKSQMRNAATNYGKAFYGKFAATEQAKQLNGKPVLLIDDNVNSGKSFAEAAKALFMAGIVPSKILGFVLHKFS